MPIKVVLVDDHTLVRQGIRGILEQDGGIEVVGEAQRAEEVEGLLRQTNPDVLLLDLQLPDGNGAELCWQAIRQCPGCNVLVLTAFLNQHLVKRCLSSGARGYLLKDTDGLDLVSSVKLVAQGKTVFDPRVVSIEHAMSGASRQLFQALSPKEMQVLNLVCLGYTNDEIAEALAVTVNTVKTHVKSVARKLQCRNRTEIAFRAHELNLV